MNRLLIKRLDKTLDILTTNFLIFPVSVHANHLENIPKADFCLLVLIFGHSYTSQPIIIKWDSEQDFEDPKPYLPVPFAFPYFFR